MDGSSIRKVFLNFFAERGHTIVPSAPLIPDDPTLLLTNAGMVPFKPYFVGQKTPPYRRATSVQKCFRTVDLEEVGRTARHLTFFEMLGNFSFGDYFKQDACRWAWELVTTKFLLEPERLWATVYETDDEAAEIWEKVVGVPPERILRRGREDNFWSMGVAGPSGPCSELLYDRGEAFGATYTGRGSEAEIDGERYLEIWNLVFMQYLQDDRGEIVGNLPKPSVDTGAGLERIAAILQDVPTAFETDLLAPILKAAEEVTGAVYGETAATDMSLRVLADHPRAMALLIADGVLPSNEGRGYVLRRLIRRAVRQARLLGVDRPLLTELAAVAVDLFGPTYPEVARSADLIRRVIASEEARFDDTLRRGLARLEDEIALAKARGEAKLDGKVVFELHDTYGFPFDLTAEFATDEGLVVDPEEFEEHMSIQRRRAKEARRSGGELSADAEVLRGIVAGYATEFLGYEVINGESSVELIIRGLAEVRVLEEGQDGELVLDRTTFYPEGGGQIGDRGTIVTPTGRFSVEDTQRLATGGPILHRGRVVAGEIRVGQHAEARVDPSHRAGVQRSHTATHMIHWALRDRLGEHAHQKGSLVEPGRLRFDFQHFEPVGAETLARIEEEVNSRVLSDDAVHAFETTYDQATALGAMALFGEKYGDYVRVVEVGDYSKELCGGTHVHHTGQVGVIKILGESSIAAGTRRIESYTGIAGLNYLNAQAERLRRAADLLRTDPEGVVDKLEKLLETSKALEAQLSKQKAAGVEDEVKAILASDDVRPVGSSKLVVLKREGRSVDELRKLAITLRDRLAPAVVALGTALDGKANLVVAVSRDLVQRGVSAQDLVAPGAARLGGRGGGKPDLVVGGGTRVAELDAALDAVRQSAQAALEGAG